MIEEVRVPILDVDFYASLEGTLSGKRPKYPDDGHGSDFYDTENSPRLARKVLMCKCPFCGVVLSRWP